MMVLLVGLCGSVGTLMRYAISELLFKHRKKGFPWHTWFVNLAGSFLLGMFYILHERQDIPEEVWYMAGTGFCGGFTTFSTFSVEIRELLRNGRPMTAMLYMISSVLSGILLAIAGIRMLQ